MLWLENLTTYSLMAFADFVNIAYFKKLNEHKLLEGRIGLDY